MTGVESAVVVSEAVRTVQNAAGMAAATGSVLLNVMEDLGKSIGKILV